MKKILTLVAAVFLTIAAATAQDDFSAQIRAHEQSIRNLQTTWATTIPVNGTQTAMIDRLLLAWAAKNPVPWIKYYQEYLEAPVNFNSEIVNIDYAPKNGYLSVRALSQYNNDLDACYWNLANGNKLLGIYLLACHEVDESDPSANPKFDDVLMFYEYDVQKKQLTPRPEMAARVTKQVGKNAISLPKQGRDITYYDFKVGATKTIKWNNGF